MENLENMEDNRNKKGRIVGRGGGLKNLQIFLETLFICNDINKNLNQNFQSLLSYHSFKLLFLFFKFVR